MFDTVFGLPMHPLVVHATVVAVPLAAVAVALAAFWPRFRERFSLVPLVLSVVALVLVPLSTSSGESLERRVPDTRLVHQHAELADGLLPWIVLLTVVAAAVWWLQRRTHTTDGSVARRPGTPVLAVLAVLTVVGVVGTSVQIVRIGHSGAKAAWSKVAQTTPRPGGDDG